MALLNFPSNPNVGDTFTIGNRTWVWNGNGWQLQTGVTSFDPFTANRVIVTTSTNSTSTNTGGLIVYGGVGIGLDVTVGGSIHVLGTDSSYSSTSGAVTIVGGLGVGGNIYGGALYDNNSRVVTQATLASQGVTALYGGTDTAVSSQTGVVYIWNTSTLQSVTNRGNSTNAAIFINNTFDTINTSTGALVVDGGVGIGKSVIIGGNETVIGNVQAGGSLTVGGKFNTIGSTTTVSVNATTATVSILGSPSNAYQLLLANYPSTDGIGFGIDQLGLASIGNFGQNAGDLVLFAGSNVVPAIRIGGLTGQVRIVQTTSATNTNTGALIVSGGAGFSGSIYVQNTSYVDSAQIITTSTIQLFAVSNLRAGTDTAISTSTGDVIVWNTSTLQTVTDRGNTTTNLIKILSTTPSSNTTTGALQVLGGVGIGGDAWVGGNLYVNGSAVVTQGTLGQQGVVAIVAGTDTAVSTASGSVSIWNTSTLQSITNRGGTTTNAISITNGTSSTNFQSGALLVAGGVGIGNNLYVQGTISASGGFLGLNPASIFQNTSSVTVLDTGSVRQVTVTVASNTSTVFLDTSTNFYTDVKILSPTGSTATTNGSLVVAGGVGITGNTYIGGTSFIKGAEILTTATVGTYSVNRIVAGTDTAALLTGTTVYIWNTGTLQTITSRGSSTNQVITITNQTDTAGTSSGALVVGGGLGIGKNLYVGGDTTLVGNLTVLGTQTTIYSTSTLSILDPMIEIGAPDNLGPLPTDDGLDKGLLIRYNTLTNSSGDTHAFFGFQRQTEKFIYMIRTPQRGRIGIDNPFVLPIYGPAQFGSLTLSTGIESTDVASGDLVTTGGAGIGGNLNISGNTKVRSGTSATSTTTGALTVLGGVGITGDIYVGGNGFFGGSLVLTTATIGTSGIGVVNIIAGTDTAVTTATGAVTIWNTSTLQSVTNRGNSTTNSISILNGLQSTTTNNGALVVAGGVGILKNLNIGGDTVILSTSTSAGTSTGALIVGGGVGVGGNGNFGGSGAFAGGGSFGGTLTVGSSAVSASTTSGAFTVTGGAGIGGAINVGNTATIGGAITAAGTATFGTNLIVGNGAVNRGGIASEVFANGNFTTPGDAQSGVYLLRVSTNTSSFIALTSDSLSVSSVNQIVLPDNSTYTFRINVTARGTTSTQDGGWSFSGVISRYAGPGTTVMRVVNKEKLWATTATWDCNVIADVTNGALQVLAHSDGTNAAKFVAKVETVEVTT